MMEIAINALAVGMSESETVDLLMDEFGISSQTAETVVGIAAMEPVASIY